MALGQSGERVRKRGRNIDDLFPPPSTTSLIKETKALVTATFCEIL
jgi:hypothetical protein